MKIFEFIDKYCSDIVKEQKRQLELVDLSDYPHDVIITDDDGNRIPVVVVDAVDIPVSDFLTLERKDFLAAHNTPNAPEAFDNYISAFEILEGVDALNVVRLRLEQARKKYEHEVELISDYG